MPAPQVAAQLKKQGGPTLKFDEQFSQPVVSVEFGQLTTTHETIGNDKITQVYGEKATSIQLDGVIRQEQIETAYDLSNVDPGGENTVKVILEEWSGIAVVDSNASIKPRKEIYQKDGDSFWLYDLTMSFVEVDRKPATELVSNPTATNETSGADSGSGSGSGSDAGSSSTQTAQSSSEDSESSGPDEPPSLSDERREISEDDISGILTTGAIESRAADRISARADGITQVSFSNTRLTQRGGSSDTATLNASYYHAPSGETESVELKYVIEEEDSGILD